jgi:hypothetical protein
MAMLERKVTGTHEILCDGSRKIGKTIVEPITNVTPKNAVIIIFQEGNSKALCPYKNSYFCEAVAPINGSLKLPCIYEKLI